MGHSLAGLIGREYLRVSVKGDRSIPEQHDDNTRAAEREGVTLGVSYEDEGKSASRSARKARPDFDRLIDDLKNDTFGADILWLWESSRGSRRVSEWTLLIDLCEDRRVLIYITKDGRVYDPTNARDRKSLQEDAVDSEYESEKNRERTQRAMDANARDGKPHGICPFGYAREYVIVRGKRVPVRQFADPIEGPLVVELFKRVRARDPFTVIEADWKARGIVGRRGKPLSAQTLRDLVTHICYIGLRSTKEGPVKAAWDRLVSDELFYDVQRIISDPARVKGNPGVAQYALTGGITCDKCSGPITVRYRDGREPTYECKAGCWRISKAEVDAFLIGDAEAPGEILRYLAREDVYEEPEADPADGEAAEIRDALAKARADLQETQQAEPETLEEERRFARREKRLEAEIADLEERQRKLTRPTKLSELFQPGPGVAARWERTPVAAQRTIVGLLFSRDIFGEARITPAAGRSVPVTERIKWVTAA